MQNTAPSVQPSSEYANALASGTQLMEYRLDRVLGAGGFGITYLGWDATLEKKVAIKEYLPAQLAVRALDGAVVPIATEQKHDYAWGLARFVQEARTLARFSHPHIVRVIRYIEANGTAYLVMEYEAGQSLAQWLGVNPRPVEAVLRPIVHPLLDGLEAMHAQGFLHRDIKPGNIFVRADNTPVLLDFGAARQAVGHKSMSLTSIVSPGYAPLEQYYSNGNQGPWTDIYSLGAVLLRAITGRNPPEAVSRLSHDLVEMQLEAATARYSASFLQAVRVAMTMDEKLRPQSIGEWRKFLFDCDAQGPPAARSSGSPPDERTKTTQAGDVSAKPRARTPSTIVDTGRHRAVPHKDGRRWPWVVAGMVMMAGLGLFMRSAPDRPQRLAGVDRVVPASQQHATTRPAEVDLAHESAVAKAPPQHLKPLPKPPAAVMRDFQLADLNGDGAITHAEAQARMPRLAQNFARADLNADGRITPTELRQFLHAGPERASVAR